MNMEKVLLFAVVFLVPLGLSRPACAQTKPPGLLDSGGIPVNNSRRSFLDLGGMSGRKEARSGRPTPAVAIGPIVNKGSGKCLDVYKGSRENEANVQQFECTNELNQTWGLVSAGGNEYAIVNMNSGKVLDVYKGSTDNSANVQQFQWHGGPNQRWRIEPGRGGFFRIVNVRSGKCLDVERSSTQNEANVIQFDCHNGDNQLWRIGQK
jgi:hypothetical protein